VSEPKSVDDIDDLVVEGAAHLHLHRIGGRQPERGSELTRVTGEECRNATVGTRAVQPPSDG
jgi:hypothetical protein